jgi:dihydrofolate reductase
MGRVIVVEFVSVDGVMQDPDGREGFARGGWAFRYGPEAVAGDRFLLGDVLDSGTLLLGRRTWELFAKIWPGRDDPFSAKMNAIPKLVVSRSRDDVTGWQNSRMLRVELTGAVRERTRAQDVVVVGSASVVRALMASDLVDEYRLRVFPLVVGEGTRVFPEGGAPANLALMSAQTVGPAVRLTYARGTGIRLVATTTGQPGG